MSWLPIAKKDFQDALRSRALVGLTGLFVLFAAGFTYLFGTIPGLFGGSENPSTTALIAGLQSSGAFLVPLVALIIGYKSIVGERDSGSLNLLLGLPHTRFDVILGKLVGRTAVVSVSILVGFAAGAVVALVFYDSFAVVPFMVFTLVTIVCALVFVGIAVGFSAAIRSTGRALYGAIGLYVLFQFVWAFIPMIVRYVLNGFTLPNMTTMPNWAWFLSLLNPLQAYNYAAGALIPELTTISDGLTNSPFYIQEWFGFVILAVWLIVPLGLGYRRFSRTDL